jgi:DNA polymerase III sliding clamp (beta) subunit (PCNA family)
MKLTKKELKFLIDGASSDVTRAHLNQIRFDDGRAVSTDGHTLQVICDPVGGPAFSVSRQFAQSVYRAMLPGSSAEFSETEGMVTANLGPYAISGKGSDAQFPPYRQVIPDKEAAGKVTTLSADFLKHAATIGEFAKVRGNPVEITIHKELEPITFASSNGDRKYLCVVMPMRAMVDSVTASATSLAMRGGK